MELSPSWKAAYSRTSQHFMKTEVSLPCSPELSIGPYPEPDRSSPYHPILFLILVENSAWNLWKFWNCEASFFTNISVNKLNKIISHYSWPAGRPNPSLLIVNIFSSIFEHCTALSYSFFYLVCETIGTAATPGLLCQPRDIVKMIVESRWNVDGQGKPKFSEKTCPSATFVHHKIPHA
jgi:hypothetical protein